ncbi:hypothetical protein BZG36_05406 [Bifiguratus adelaidae]|uniref:Major facilitator superfamily (MFS) profile domain-containing protein n=1 Tax=Bifiguratus adelaidae TaxID=1938954 RepID=A0A261XTE8_9FUNG|nr:hypothetical protein BZG36_05406 [Bifiguratus adelaidae]
MTLEDEETLRVVGVFLVTFVVFGFSASWGVLQLAFLASFAILGGSLEAAFIFVIGPVAGPLIFKVGVRNVLILGSLILCLGVFLTSLIRSLWPLFFKVSLFAGVGSSMIFITSISIPAKWFTKKQGLALGIAASGGGFGGTTMFEINPQLIATVGLPWALRIQGLIRAAYRKKKAERCVDSKLLKMIHYDFLLLSAFLYGFGYLVTFFYIPSYAATKGFGAVNGSTAVAVYSAANGLGRLVLGTLGDVAGNFNMLILSNLLTGFLFLVVWNVTENLGALYTFSILGGFFSGGYWSVITAVVGQVVGLENLNTAMSILWLVNIPGFIFGGPITSGILQASKDGSYTGAISFGGAFLFASGAVLLYSRFTLEKRLLAKV